MSFVDAIYSRRLKAAIRNPDKSDNQEVDYNGIMAQIWIKTIFKTVRLIVIIFMISYYAGMIFYIFCDLTNNIAIIADDYDEGNQVYNNFIQFFDIDKETSGKRAIIMTYFAITSLSTVGFGDYNPRSNIERIFICFVLVIGVAIFSYFMCNFTQIIQEMGEIESTFSDGDNLTKFFGTIKRFNANQDNDHDLMLRIEEFFEYKWAMDCNLAISTKEDFDLLN